MSNLQLKRCVLCNLKSYDLSITTSFETKHGISGHLFEMIEYFYHFKFQKGIKCCILISDGTTYDEFFNSLLNKYEFSDEELKIIKENTFFKFQPMTLICNDILFVDGSLRVKNSDILCKRKIFLRCSDDEFLDKADLVLQDYDLYEPINNSKHYKKKLLFSKFKANLNGDSKIAMFYSTSNMRKLSFSDLEKLTEKYNFEKYIILSNFIIETPKNVELKLIPIKDLWSSFGTYIYTGSTNVQKIDCSSRFIAECKFYNKEVIYNSMQMDKGLEVRKFDIENNVNLELKVDDEITKLITGF